MASSSTAAPSTDVAPAPEAEGAAAGATAPRRESTAPLLESPPGAEDGQATSGASGGCRLLLGTCVLAALLGMGATAYVANLARQGVSSGACDADDAPLMCKPEMPTRDLFLRVFGTVTYTSTTTTTTLTTRTTTQTDSRTTITTITSTATLGPDSLFCFALVQPEGYELDLIKWLHKKQKSLFLCNRHAIYSNKTLHLHGLKNLVVKTSLDAEIGGEWNTALNTPIFQKLWTQVIEDGQFREASWTAKVDVDAVFLPGRLHELLETHDYQDAQKGNGHFLNNCEVKGSLHGPIEVLSRRAVEVFGERYTECDQSWQQEDVFTRMCLVSLDVVEHFDYVIMSEQWCNDDWESCSTRHITFHPYKTVDAYKECLLEAEVHGSENWWL